MGKRLKLVRLVADLSLLLFQHGAEFVRTLCIIPITGNNYHASFTIWVEIGSPPLLKSKRVSRIYN